MISTNFTEAPALTIPVTVGTAVFEVVITSLLAVIPKAFNERKIASFQINLESPNIKSIYKFYPPDLNKIQLKVLKQLLYSKNKMMNHLNHFRIINTKILMFNENEIKIMSKVIQI